MMTTFAFKPKLLQTLLHYNKQQFTTDLLAGIIVGIVALPLAIAFGIASGVTPEKGISAGRIEGADRRTYWCVYHHNLRNYTAVRI